MLIATRGRAVRLSPQYGRMWHMLPGDTDALRKARGAFFTPVPVARYINGWAVRSSGDHVLEPSCGKQSSRTTWGWPDITKGA